jgi:hypothetical protein
MVSDLPALGLIAAWAKNDKIARHPHNVRYHSLFTYGIQA